MADPPIVRVDGARQLRSALRRAGEDLGDLRKANAEAAGTVSAASVGRAPRLTGRLAANVRPGATQTQAIVRAGGTRVPYAQAIHWGWPRRGIKAQPFITEAAQATEPVWLRPYERALAELVARVERTAHP